MKLIGIRVIEKIHLHKFKTSETHRLICSGTDLSFRGTIYFYVWDQIRAQIALQTMNLITEQVMEMKGLINE
jgi:hypothetical protein